jgi:hypothetical protein
MERSLPPSDWVVYVVVLGTVAAIMLGKWLMFFNDKQPPKQTEPEELDDEVEHILEETLEEKLDETISKVKK